MVFAVRDFTQRETALLRLYASCQLQLSPQEFYAKWDVTHRQMAQICRCSVSTVDRWFSHGTGHRSPDPIHLRRLAEMDFLLECYEQIPLPLRQRLCPRPPFPEHLAP
ncbi:MAG: helix-turn-helix transcriptional regulator [Synechococcales bacterium]|nr:helix-turn-helix transcriptional regulator [Synechococcales bacterium]